LDKPIVVAVHGAAIGGGTTMLTHCDFIYAGESTKFQMPFINLAVVPEFGSSCSVPARIGHLRAAELILLGGPYDARRAAELGLEMCRPAAYGAELPLATVTNSQNIGYGMKGLPSAWTNPSQTATVDVCCWRKSRKYLLVPSISHFDPLRTITT
jgi:hypothetical protein